MKALVELPAMDPAPARLLRMSPPFRIELLQDRRGGPRSAMAGVSLVAHAALIAAVVVLPLILSDQLPDPTSAIRTFFVAPAAITPAPPPPPPPAAAARSARRAPIASTPPPPSASSFRAPLEVPEELPLPEPELDVGLGVEGGMPGGVEGGIAGGVAGGVVGGTLGAIEPVRPPIRIGGAIKEPKILRRVAPIYPPLARQARVAGRIELEAMVNERGVVTSVRVVRGIPLLDQAAVEAVRQWRYQPLLLNGEPHPFVLTVGVSFNLVSGTP